ncbi:MULTISPECIES: TetR/AcrR family transcriptional regulator [unclassified Mycolicibacterium]|uniref:TetR/AcrR family transcriptional regulator n=1 Tax=unclassified Mycolicibacterium TaxID=2636767 RepID=UPI0012DC1A29|nr:MULTISPECIES: TetR/AcrR family transcriptional regulator [unclassified Mycolicibacterium]MUL83048.1 TetR/AcrR family transcriptional regulator [Mycolicibacterium sp. CBMA 329]MUL89383.1 TetR/AcrR family transcriptional regulator [Mycolicibacterium sp. CBMA 331]MUL99072.1 TetR/AcrR family transcriptional regulator [Mycolicibacterium sp. CBMA 334]MUM24698.1 TetR/AcrR family transcriptional regulator [Mycolicibacterium sp. CBMA 295]MUM38899.1 TetR/AcrR family transcriptional regulator [Mycolic
MAAGSTRERLVTEAMKLFSDRGFEATSVSQIEAAAGLSAGSGALYRHFKSKDALLAAGIDRQLDRRSAMHDIRNLFAGLGDLHSELTVLGRYLLTVIDQESELLQIAARTPAGLSERLDTAYAALVDGLCDELNGWISAWAPHASPGQTRVLASLGINSLLGERFAANLFRRSPAPVSDGEYLTEWTATLAARVQSLS